MLVNDFLIIPPEVLMIKKADIILTVILIIAGLAISYAFSTGKTAGDELLITADGRKFGSYSLLEDRNITVKQEGHINKVTIKDGVVSMTFSDCKGQDCVKQHSISETGETIICLPNKIVLEITGGENKYDAVAR